MNSMTFIINGKKIAQIHKAKIKKEIKKRGLTPGLALVLVGNDPASEIYVRYKKLACEEVGIRSFIFNLAETASEDEILSLVNKLNRNKAINGILVQLPLPNKINKASILEAINPNKDLDGLNPANIGRTSAGTPGFRPCTPAGIIKLLESSKISIEGKHAVVIGRSEIVGKPIAMMLLNAGATVTVCHSKTKSLKSITKMADILIVAVGRSKMIKKDMIKKGAVVIDVGINRNKRNQLTGDVDFEKVSPLTSAITPVPGGVGPMTIAMLMQNCLDASINQIKDKKK